MSILSRWMELMIVEMLDIISDFNVIGGDGEVEDMYFGEVGE